MFSWNFRHYENIRGVQIIIQSTIKDPTQLDQRTEAFFLQFERELQRMSDEEFKNYVNILMDLKMEKYKNLWEESDFYWREINDGSLQFDRRDIEGEALKALKKEDLITFFNQKIRRNGSERRKLSVHVFGSQHHRQLAIAKGEVTQKGLGLSQPNHVNGLDVVTEWKLPDNSTHNIVVTDKLGNNLLLHDQQSLKMPKRIDNVQVFKRSQSFYCSPKLAL